MNMSKSMNTNNQPLSSVAQYEVVCPRKLWTDVQKVHAWCQVQLVCPIRALWPSLQRGLSMFKNCWLVARMEQALRSSNALNVGQCPEESMRHLPR